VNRLHNGVNRNSVPTPISYRRNTITAAPVPLNSAGRRRSNREDVPIGPVEPQAFRASVLSTSGCRTDARKSCAQTG